MLILFLFDLLIHGQEQLVVLEVKSDIEECFLCPVLSLPAVPVLSPKENEYLCHVSFWDQHSDAGLC